MLVHPLMIYAGPVFIDFYLIKCFNLIYTNVGAIFTKWLLSIYVNSFLKFNSSSFSRLTYVMSSVLGESMRLNKSDFQNKIKSWGNNTSTHVVFHENHNNSDVPRRFDIYVRDGIENRAHLHIYTIEYGEKPDEMKCMIGKMAEVIQSSSEVNDTIRLPF